jgi:large subunit ribosomal protein L17
MRHRVAHRKLGRTTSHRLALLRSLATALFERERIRTTLMKAKELRPYAEKLITLAKRDDRLHARRQVAADIKDNEVVKKLFDTLGTRYATRPGGYTRILRLGPRKGDGAEMAIVELLGSEYQPKKDGKAEVKVAEPKKAAVKKADKPKAEKKAKADKGEAVEKKPAKSKKKAAEASK